MVDLGILNREMNGKEIIYPRNTDTISQIMKRYLDLWGLKPNDKQKKFCEAYWSKLIDRAIDEAIRIPLPHNLGYLQVLEHQLEKHNSSIEHYRKFGGVDYSIIWVRHPLFVHHKFTFDKSLRKRIHDNVLKGVKYLTEYVDGDTYVA